MKPLSTLGCGVSSLVVAIALASPATTGAQDPSKNVDAAGKYTAPQAANAAAQAANGPLLPGRPAESATKPAGDLNVQREGPGRFRIGSVTLDSARRSVTFPATVNMDEGMVEYALVTETGKVHEALFKTAATPEQIHLAYLLVGVPPEKGGDTAVPTAKEPKDVTVSVTWDTNGPSAEHDMSQMVVTAEDVTKLEGAKPMPIGPWKYTGSVTDGLGFAASREGSIIALISDQAALVNDPRETSKRDDNHFPNKALVPPKGNSVRIVLTFPDAPKAR